MSDSALRAIAEVKTPVALCAVAIWVVAGLYKTVLGMDIFPRLDRERASRLLRLIVILAFLLAALTLVAWQASRYLSRQQPSGTEEVNDKTVELNFREADLAKVLSDCARQAGAVLALDQQVKGKISIHMKTRLADVMNTICEAHNCDWEIDPGSPPALFVRQKAPSPPH